MMIPPGPKGSLLLGSLPNFQKNSLDFLVKAANQYGDVVRFRFAYLQAFLINNPDLIKQALQTKADNFDKNTRSARAIQETCGYSLLSSNQHVWERHRKLIQPVFQPRFIETMDDIIDQKIVHLLQRWDEISRLGEKIDVVSEITHLVIDITSRIFFSSDVDAKNIESALAVLLDDTWRRLNSPINLSSLTPFFHRQEFKNALAEIDTIVFDIIARRHREPMDSQSDNVLLRLLHAHEGNGNFKLSDQELRDAVITLLLAGHETTSNALAWSLYLLAKEPSKVRDDFENVFLETLRLYPSIWIIERRATRTTKIGDYIIPKGASLLISPYVLHRNTAYWNEPETFNPDRFIEDAREERPRHAFLPFGLGAHRCVGLHMATRIATKVLKAVCENFSLQMVSDEAPLPDPGITLRHKQSIWILLKKTRNND